MQKGTPLHVEQLVRKLNRSLVSEACIPFQGPAREPKEQTNGIQGNGNKARCHRDACTCKCTCKWGGICPVQTYCGVSLWAITTPARHIGHEFASYKLLGNFRMRTHQLDVASGVVDTIMPSHGNVSMYRSRVCPPCKQGARSMQGSSLHEPLFTSEILQSCRPKISIQQ